MFILFISFTVGRCDLPVWWLRELFTSDYYHYFCMFVPRAEKRNIKAKYIIAYLYQSFVVKKKRKSYKYFPVLEHVTTTKRKTPRSPSLNFTQTVVFPKTPHNLSKIRCTTYPILSSAHPASYSINLTDYKLLCFFGVEKLKFWKSKKSSFKKLLLIKDVFPME